MQLIKSINQSLVGIPVFCIGAAAIAAANDIQITPEEFAYGIEIKIDDKSALQVFDLSPTVYRGVARRDLGDIRIFNADRQSLSYQLKRKTINQEHSEVIELPIFPIYASVNNNLDGLSFQLNRTEAGTKIDIRETENLPPGEKTLLAYIFDNRVQFEQEDLKITSLIFDWSGENQKFIKNIKIERSDDLVKWTSVVSDGVLSRLTFAGEQLEKSTIELPAVRSKFLRISWPKMTRELIINAVQAEVRAVRSEFNTLLQAQDNSLRRDKQSAEKFGENSFRFNIDGRYPVQQITLTSQVVNTLYKGVVYSRSGPDTDWIQRAGFTQYRLMMPEAEISSNPIRVSAIRDAEWLVQFLYPSQLTVAPTVRVAWIAERVVFVAQGRQPYTLAYGNPNISSPEKMEMAAIKAVVNAEIQPALAALGESFRLGGEEKLKLAAKPFAWQVLLLWFVLITGVFVMIWMAYGLFKQMNKA